MFPLLYGREKITNKIIYVCICMHIYTHIYNIYVYIYFYKISLMRRKSKSSKSTAGFVSLMLNYISDMDTIRRIKWRGVIKVHLI